MAINKEKIFKIISTNPSMVFSEFQRHYNGPISDRYFYMLRDQFNGKDGGMEKRKYVRKKPFSKKEIGKKAIERRPYNKTTTCLILWSKDTSKMKVETISTIHEVIRSMEKSKKLGFELVETVNPSRLELREYSK